MIAGAGGGLVASVATCPLDVIKTKLQAQRKVVGQQGYEGIIDTVKSVLRHDGLRGMYRGLGPTILGYLPTWAIYFAVYDGIKSYFGQPPFITATRERLYPAAQVKGYQPVMREHPWSLHIFSAMAAGAASTFCTNPLWVIKTRFMVQFCVFSNALVVPHNVHIMLLCPDAVTRRSQISTHPRRRPYYLSLRGPTRLLSGSFPQSSWNHTCRSSISVI
jgi:hypothetical protein